MAKRNTDVDETVDVDSGSTRDDLKEQASRVKQDAGELLELARDAAREEFAKLKSAAGDGLAAGRERLEESISKRPKMTLLMAAGAGLLLGIFLCRKR